MSDSLSRAVADWATTAFSRREVPTAVLAATGTHLVDTVAVMLAGSATAPVSAMREAARGRGEQDRTALVFGTAAHALDYDNAQTPSLVHPSCVIVPTALAIAAHAEIEAGDLLYAIALGEEISLWLGEAAVTDGNSVLFDSGFHPTAVCTPIGAAVTAGLLRGLDAEELTHAIGTAASLSGGILEGNRTGGDVKPMHAGFASSAGIFAASLAAAGATAPPTALEGRFGFLRAFTGTDDFAGSMPGAGGWRSASVITKPYPVNGFTHAAIDVTLRLRDKGFRLEPGATLRIGVAEPVLRTIAEPEQLKYAPPSAYAARFSGPIVVAIAALGGSGLGVGLSDLDVEELDPQVLAAAQRVRFVADPDATAAFPARLAARADAADNQGRHYTDEIDASRGAPGNPLSDIELRAKFDDCVTGTAVAADELWAALHTVVGEPGGAGQGGAGLDLVLATLGRSLLPDLPTPDAASGRSGTA